MHMKCKILALVIAMSFAPAFVTPTVAGETPTAMAECEKAGMKWSEQSATCTEWKPSVPAPVRNVLGMIGIVCGLVGFVMVCRMWIAERRRTYD
jgi:hypothetical protein